MGGMGPSPPKRDAIEIGASREDSGIAVPTDD